MHRDNQQQVSALFCTLEHLFELLEGGVATPKVVVGDREGTLSDKKAVDVAAVLGDIDGPVKMLPSHVEIPGGELGPAQAQQKAQRIVTISIRLQFEPFFERLSSLVILSMSPVIDADDV
jgi:hypothetical protein